MLVKLSTSALKDSRWYEYAVRFALGGAAAMVTGAIGNGFGPEIGGLFLALPAIFCASATLIEKHEIRHKREAGLDGTRRGQEAAALDAAGAAMGSFGMLAFAAAFAVLVEQNALLAFPGAIAAWSGVSLCAWLLRRKIRMIRR
jgi:hypothetical protein